MLQSRWEITQRRHEDRLLLEIPAQVPLKLLLLMGVWLALWPIGILLIPVYLDRWIEHPGLWLVLALLAVILWMVPWYRYLRMLPYLWRGRERITIRPGLVEIERGVGRCIERQCYAGVDPASWRVSPWKHHVRDWQGVMSPASGGPGLWAPGGALTFTHHRRAIRCGRNFGTRRARVVLHEIQEFLGVSVEREKEP
jgi:hypothetical protein